MLALPSARVVVGRVCQLPRGPVSARLHARGIRASANEPPGPVGLRRANQYPEEILARPYEQHNITHGRRGPAYEPSERVQGGFAAVPHLVAAVSALSNVHALVRWIATARAR